MTRTPSSEPRVHSSSRTSFTDEQAARSPDETGRLRQARKSCASREIRLNAVHIDNGKLSRQPMPVHESLTAAHRFGSPGSRRSGSWRLAPLV